MKYEHYVYEPSTPKKTLYFSFDNKTHHLITNDDFLDSHWVFECYHVNGVLHSPFDLPAYVTWTLKKLDALYWFNDGKMHRWHGPSIINLKNGVAVNEQWYFHNVLISKERIHSTMEQLDLSKDWRSWTEEEKIMFKLAV